MDETLSEQSRVPSNLSTTFKNFLSLLKNREFMGYAMAQGFIMAGIFAYVAGTPFVYQNIYEVSPQMFSLLFGMNGIGLIIGAQTVGRLTGVLTEKQFLEIGLLLSITSGTALLIAVLMNGPLLSIVIPIFFFVSLLVLFPRHPFHWQWNHKGILREVPQLYSVYCLSFWAQLQHHLLELRVKKRQSQWVRLSLYRH